MSWMPAESLYKQSFPSSQPAETENKKNEASDQTLEVNTCCIRLRDKVTVVLELKPTDGPAKSLYGGCATGNSITRAGNGYPGSRDHQRGYGGRSSHKDSSSTVVTPRPPMRLACVIDVSHSMAEPFGADDVTEITGGSRKMPKQKLTKLERVKLFAELLVKTIGHDDQLAIVTFGTTSRVVFSMRRMTDEAKKECLAAIRTIEVAGVTNMSAGIFSAIDQFNLPFAKSRCFNDNIFLFTDGMANEGLSDSADLIREIRKRVRALKDECHFETDYSIKFSTLGTGGFLPELIYDLSQAFGSDAFYYIDEKMSMEMDLMTPILMRQCAAVSNVNVTVTTLNGVKLDRTDVSKEYVTTVSDPSDPQYTATTETYMIHEIANEMSRHIVLRLLLPAKHKKVLKAKDVLSVTVSYKDSLQCCQSIDKTIVYSEIPINDAANSPSDMLVYVEQEIRRRAVEALSSAAASVARLDRARARDNLKVTGEQLRIYTESMFDDHVTEEEYRAELTGYTEAVTSIMTYFDRLVGDLSMRWDDVWAQLKSVETSLSRQVPTTAPCRPVQAVGCSAEESPAGTTLFGSSFGSGSSNEGGAGSGGSRQMRERIKTVSDALTEVYRSMGLDVDTVLEKYKNVVEELDERIDEDSLYGQSFSTGKFGLF